MSTITDATDARTLLERAIAATSQPALSTSDVDLLLRLAESVDANGATVWTVDALNASAATGWTWKAGLTAENYDLGGGAGVALNESQWHKHCLGMARGYGSGEFSVTGASPSTARGTIGSIVQTTAVRASSNRWYPEG